MSIPMTVCQQAFRAGYLGWDWKGADCGQPAAYARGRAARIRDDAALKATHDEGRG